MCSCMAQISPLGLGFATYKKKASLQSSLRATNKTESQMSTNVLLFILSCLKFANFVVRECNIMFITKQKTH